MSVQKMHPSLRTFVDKIMSTNGDRQTDRWTGLNQYTPPPPNFNCKGYTEMMIIHREFINIKSKKCNSTLSKNTLNTDKSCRELSILLSDIKH